MTDRTELTDDYMKSNRMTGYPRVWYRHRLSMDGKILQINVDIGHPHYLFKRTPHLLAVRHNSRRPREKNISSVIDELPAELSSDGERVLLSTLHCDEFVEGNFWCDDDAADAIAAYESEGVDVFSIENDGGDFFRDFVLPPDFLALADSGKRLSKGLALRHELSPCTHRVFHQIEFSCVEKTEEFCAMVIATDFDVVCNVPESNPMLAVVVEVSDLDPTLRHVRLAEFFVLAESCDGVYRGWKDAGSVEGTGTDVVVDPSD